MSAQTMGVGPPGPASPHRSVVLAFAEALQSENGGEVVVKAGTATGRVFVSRGRVAWATASTFPLTFGARVVNAGLASRADLRAVFEDCRRSGKNFAEALVEGKVIELERLRQELLGHVADAFRELLSWTAPTALFVPSSRSYGGPLTFTFPEIFDAVDREAGAGPRVPFELRAVAASGVVGQLVERALEVPGLGGGPAPSGSPLPARPAGPLAAAGPSGASRAAKATTPAAPDAPRAVPVSLPPPAPRPEPTATQVRVVGDLAARLRGLEDYRAAGFCALDGTLLGSDRQEGAVDPAAAAVAAGHILSMARDAATGAAEAVVWAETGVLVLRSIIVKGLGEIGAFLVLGPAGNAALARIQVDRLLPDVVAAIS